MEGSVVESGSVLADGTVLPPGRRIPGKQLWAGNPARYVRDLTYDELHDISHTAEDICAAAADHAAQLLPHSDFNAYGAAMKLRAALAGA
jgi:carbonic anhydrase/acetyltransferase-like protein (isoleucine patch superfamily)